jgi:hypothetical protein
MHLGARQVGGTTHEVMALRNADNL